MSQFFIIPKVRRKHPQGLNIFVQSWGYVGVRLAIFVLWLLAIAMSIAQKIQILHFCKVTLMLLGWIYIPILLVKIAMWLFAKIKSYFSFALCYNLTQNIQQQIRSLQLNNLNEHEKTQLCEFLQRFETIKAIQRSLHEGYQGIVFLKKNHEKPRSSKQTQRIEKTKVTAWNVPSHHRHSSFSCAVDRRLPRKVIIAFKDLDRKTSPDTTVKRLAFSSGLGLAIDLHVLNKSKLAGGAKECFYCSNKTAVGAFTVCEYSEALSSQRLGLMACAVLRKRGINEEKEGILHSYRIEKSSGESLGRFITRRLARKVKHKSEQTLDIVNMLSQVQSQLSHLHKNGLAHMDLKVENITVCYDHNNNLKFTVIDYPSKSALNGVEKEHSTPWFGEMSNIHGLLSQVITHNRYQFWMDCEAPCVNIDSGISYDHRKKFEALLAKFEERKPRLVSEGISQEPIFFSGTSSRNNECYITIAPNTIFHDTWAVLYVAFIASECIDDSRTQQTEVFLLMQEMYADYVQWWKLNGGVSVSKKDSCIRYMNQNWALDLIINKLKSRINTNQSTSSTADQSYGSIHNV